jgi:hypothetical protein
MANKVAIIIPNKYKNASYRDIILTNRSPPREPPYYYCINLNYAAYMPLYYIPFFPYGDRS